MFQEESNVDYVNGGATLVEPIGADYDLHWQTEDWSIVDDSDSFRGTKPSLLLLLILGTIVGWFVFISSIFADRLGIPLWATWLPYLLSSAVMLLPAVLNCRLSLMPTLNRFFLAWFLAGVAASLNNHPASTEGILRLSGYLVLALLAFVILPSAYSWDKILRVMRMVIVSAVTVTLTLSLLLFPVVVVGGTKATGLYRNRNTMGFQAFLGLVCLGAILPKNRRRAILHIGLMFFLGAMLVMSRARASILAAAVCGLLVFWRYRQQLRMWVIGLVTATSLMLFAVMFKAQGMSLFTLVVQKKLLEAGTVAGADITSGRLGKWETIMQLLEGSELTGLGVGTLVTHYGVSPHSAYMTMLGDLGYIGFFGFTFWVLGSVFQARSLRKRCDPNAAAVVHNAYVLLVGLAIFNVFENSLGGIIGLGPFAFWLVSGAIANAASKASSGEYLYLE